MTNATLVNSRVENMRVSNNSLGVGELKLASGYSIQVAFSNDGTQCIGRYVFRMMDTDHDGAVFDLEVQLAAIFTCSNAITDGLKRQIHGEVYNQMFPIMQKIVREVCEFCGMAGMEIRKDDITPDTIDVKKGSPA